MSVILDLRNDQDTTKIIELLSNIAVHYPGSRDEIYKTISQAKAGVRIEIRPKKSSRTKEQESYYRKWCRHFAEYCGLTEEEMHEELLMLCYGSHYENTMFGPRRRPIKRSSDTSKETYGLLIDTLKETANQFGFHIPNADMRNFSDE